jgi:hypothetical protein
VASEPAASVRRSAEEREQAAAARSESAAREAAQRAEASARRAEEARAHREAVEQRIRERARTAKPSVPLPPGGPASVPGR